MHKAVDHPEGSSLGHGRGTYVYKHKLSMYTYKLEAPLNKVNDFRSTHPPVKLMVITNFFEWAFYKIQ